MSTKSTLKRIAAAAVAVSALTVVGATSAEAAVQTSNPARTSTVTIAVKGTSPYAKAFNVCAKTAVVKNAKALKNAKTRAKTVKVITAKCAKVASASTASPAAAGSTGYTGSTASPATAGTSANTGSTDSLVSALNPAQVTLFNEWKALGYSDVVAFTNARSGASPVNPVGAASTGSTESTADFAPQSGAAVELSPGDVQNPFNCLLDGQ